MRIRTSWSCPALNRWLTRVGCFLVLLAIVVVAGCVSGGGGGAGAGSPGDVAGIIDSVSRLMMALRSGQAGDLGQVFSRRLQTVVGGEEGLKSLTLWDFGSDIHERSDDASWTFFLDPSQIVFVAADFAIVRTWTQFPDGSRFHLDLQFIKESGAWVIDTLEVTSAEPGTIGAGDTVTAVDLFPLARGNCWGLVRRETTASPAHFFVLRVIDDPFDRDGLKLFTLQVARNERAMSIDHTGFGPTGSPMEFGRNAAGEDFVSGGFFSASSGSSSNRSLWEIIAGSPAGSFRLANLLGLFCYGNDATFNQDQPWRLTGLLTGEGGRSEQTITIPVPGGYQSAIVRTRFMGQTTFHLPFRSVEAYRLDISLRVSETGETIYASWFLTPGLGLVGFAEYDETTRQIDGLDYLVGGTVGNSTFSSPGIDPTFNCLRVLDVRQAGDLQVGVPYVRSFVASGGTPPYSWALGDAPAWMQIDAVTGDLWGTPDASGACRFQLRVSDAGALTARYDLLWDVLPAETASAPQPATVPQVLSVQPASGAINVATNSNVIVTFSTIMAGSSVTTGTFQVSANGNGSGTGGTPVPGTLILNGGGVRATFAPASPLPSGLRITVVLDGLTSQAGVALPRQSWSFTTQPVAVQPVIDTTGPVVLAVVPAANAVNVATGTRIGVTFNEPVATATLNSTTFMVSAAGAPVAGIVTLNAGGRSATFTPLLPLPFLSTCTVTISRSVKDLAGNSMGADLTWSFRIQSLVNLPPAKPSLTSPTANQTGVALNPGLVGTAFFDADAGNLHDRTDWELYDQASLATASRVWYRTGDQATKTAIVVTATNGTFENALVVASQLATSTTYWARLRYYDSLGAVSPWSDAVSFLTDVPPQPPTLVFPTANLPDVSPNLIASASAFSDPDAGDTHLRTDWEIYNSAAVVAGNRVWKSLGESVNKTWVRVDASAGSFENALSGKTNLAYVTDYWLRVRYYDRAAVPGAWSTPVKFTTSAPVITWQKCVGGTLSDRANSVQPTSDGGLVMAGKSTSGDGDVSGNKGGEDGWIVKLDAIGNIQWQRCLGGSANDVLWSVKPTTDGGFIACGTTQSNDGDIIGNHGPGDAWVVKLNAAGAVQWSRVYGGPTGDDAREICQTSDGGFVFSAGTTSTSGDVVGNHGGWDIWIVKLNPSGTLVWSKCLGGSSNEGGKLCVNRDGTIMIGGETFSNDGNVTGNHGSCDVWAVKLSASGDLIWQRTIGGSSDEEGEGIIETADGGSFIWGRSTSANGDIPINRGYGDFLAIKLSPAGTIQWVKTYGGSNVDQLHEGVETTDQGFLIVGQSYSVDGDLPSNYGLDDVFAGKLDSFGNLVWRRAIGGSASDAGYGGILRNGDGFVLAGGTMSNDKDVSGNHGDMDGWLVRLAP